MKTEDGDSYDPHKERQVSKPLTNLEGMVHIVKGVFGVGFTGLPEAVKNAGLLLGSVGIVLIGALACHCMHMLVKCQYTLCKKHKVSFLPYRESMKLAVLEGPKCVHWFSKTSAYLTDFFLIANAFGVACVYVLFVSANLKKVGDDYNAEMDRRIWMLILLPVLITMMLIRNLKMLVPLSYGANVALVGGVIILLYFIMKDLPSPGIRPLAADPITYPLFIGKTFYSYMAVGLILAVEKEIKKPKSFLSTFGVLNSSFVFVIIISTFIGFFGYVKYGSDALCGSVTVQLPKDNLLARSVNVILALSVFISYPLQCYVAVDIFISIYLQDRFQRTGHPVLCEYILRMSIVFFTFGMAVLIPHLDLYMSLVGAMSLSSLGLTFPALVHFCVRWELRGSRAVALLLARDGFIFLLGVFTLVVGCSESIRRIILALTGDVDNSGNCGGH